MGKKEVEPGRFFEPRKKGNGMDHMKYTLAVEGASGEEAEEIAASLAEEGMAGREDAFHAYAFDLDYRVLRNGVIFFGNAGETKDDPDGFLRELSARYTEALFVRDATGYEENCGRAYFKRGRSHDAELVVRYEPFDEARLA